MIFFSEAFLVYSWIAPLDDIEIWPVYEPKDSYGHFVTLRAERSAGAWRLDGTR